jgi:23S rRNA pseudouridine1911/1915/1917 synthase
VSGQLGSLSRSTADKLIKQGNIKVNGRIETKSGYKIKGQDEIEIDYDQNEPILDPSDLKIPILYEDDDCVVIDKPVGVLSHSKGALNRENTVASWLEVKWQSQPGDRSGIVHRLVRMTSGVMICAKITLAQSWLQKQFSQRKAKKTYLALVEGLPSPEEAIIDMPIERNPKKPQTFRVGSNGKQATTTYKVISRHENFSLLELKPTTGRTHQLRVHLSKLGYPIIGDTIYGGLPADRLYLHALSLEITLPNRQRQLFESSVPAEFKAKL